MYEQCDLRMNNSKETIPIVFATNQKYLPCLGVALYSLILHASEQYEYKVYVFYKSLNRASIKKILKLATKNVSIEFCNVSAKTRQVTAYAQIHLTEESTYRLLIPEIFPKYQRVLYLDCDIVIQRDVSELYHQNLNNMIFGVIKDNCTVWVVDYCTNYLRLNYLKYFNAGVLVMDLQKMREHNIAQKCFDVLNNGQIYTCLDQDALNIVCEDLVTYLDTRWNFLWQTLYASVLEGCEDWCRQISEDAYIIHYASDKKPWSSPELELADVFWHYARQTVFYEELIFNNMPKCESTGNIYFQKGLFPYNKIKIGSDIVLYGAGSIGEAFYKQLQITGYCHVVMWLDKQYSKAQEKGFDVYPPINIKSIIFDFVVIAVESEYVASEIRSELIAMDVPNTKIIWQYPH